MQFIKQYFILFIGVVMLSVQPIFAQSLIKPSTSFRHLKKNSKFHAYSVKKVPLIDSEQQQNMEKKNHEEIEPVRSDKRARWIRLRTELFGVDFPLIIKDDVLDRCKPLKSKYRPYPSTNRLWL